MISHVFDRFSPVPGVGCLVSLNLISQGPEQAISGSSEGNMFVQKLHAGIPEEIPEELLGLYCITIFLA